MDYKYTSIDEGSRDEGSRDTDRRDQYRRDEDRRRRGGLWRAALIAAGLIGAALVGALSSMATLGVMRSGSGEEHSPHQFSCGETFDEAHQRGCKFDPLTLTWLHPKCSQYGQEEFLETSKTSSNGTWQYWEDQGGLHEIGGYEALSYQPPGSYYWTTQEEHFHHCMWMLMRVRDAATTGQRLDSKSSSFEHTKHCLDMLIDLARIGAGEQFSQVVVKGLMLDIGWTAC